MNTYRVRVLNREKQIIFDQEIQGLKQALETARAIPDAVNIGCTNKRINSPGYFEHKFKDGWQGITRGRFEQVAKEGQQGG